VASDSLRRTLSMASWSFANKGFGEEIFYHRENWR
jgi:hypothetical protein